ncbi:MAG: hypothetical protein GX596_13745 [Propionibacterium sp.]|nr:hypothetical protein [Propionibacterium sp.]
MNYVNIGGPVALAIIGAILAFAVPDALEGVDLALIGYIFMGGAALWLLLGLVVGARSRSVRTAESRTNTGDGVHVERETREA